MKIAHAPSQLERQPRAVAIGTFDGVHRGHLCPAYGRRLGPRADRGHVRSAPTHRDGNRVDLIATLERRLELLAEGGTARLVASFTPEFQRQTPEEFIATLPHVDRCGGGGGRRRLAMTRSGGPETLGAAGLELRVEQIEGVSSTAIRDAVRDGSWPPARACWGVCSSSTVSSSR